MLMHCLVVKQFTFGEPVSNLFIGFFLVPRSMDNIGDPEPIAVSMGKTDMGVIASDGARLGYLWLRRANHFADQLNGM